MGPLCGGIGSPGDCVLSGLENTLRFFEDQLPLRGQLCISVSQEAFTRRRDAGSDSNFQSRCLAQFSGLVRALALSGTPLRMGRDSIKFATGFTG